ncbi:diguanylate cyclase [Pseudodesulfovibrio sp. JC047]|uniref:diguanylate cyclase n=1 Tax=Pseudodesulfovibrio sp. JC047 TaxID=2683199 RepID=UPI0013D04095|nr:diguanylate cyclase [Pseudodesulfovibrio sp. JC047]NDV20778.1 diguanylate cyclase [Pseudodesulfovibrio sp. JC047]
MAKKSTQHTLDAALERITDLEYQLLLLQAESDAAFHQLVFDRIPGGMAIISPSGDIIACNEEAAAILGATPEYLQKENTGSFYADPADREHVRAQLDAGEIIRGHSLPLVRLDGRQVWITTNVRPIEFNGQPAALATFSDTTAHHQALNKIELAEIRFEALYTISKMTHKSEPEILNFALQAIIKVTSSEIGYIYFLNHDESKLTLHAWSDTVMEQCEMSRNLTECPVDQVGMWADAVRERRPVIINDYPNHPQKKGYPKGHIPIRNHVNIPIFEKDRIAMLAGVGNKPTDYDESDIRQLQLVMDGIWRIIQRRRANEQLEAAHEELERKVQRRTAKLKEANTQLEILNADLIQKDLEREQAKEALVRYKRIIATTPDLISLVDRNGVYQIVNESYLKMFKKKREEIIGKSVEQLVGPKVYESFSKAGIDKALTGETIRIESWINLPAAGKRYMAATYHPVSMTGETIDYISIEARDMTQLKSNEEALRVIADRLALATKAGNIGIWEWDLATDDLNWDPKMKDLYKVSPDEFHGVYETWRSRVHPDDLIQAEQQLASCIEKRGQIEFEFRIIHPDKSVHVMQSAGLVQTDENDAPLRMIGVNRDITDQRHMEKELRRLASTDPLTGAYNRRYFMKRLTDEFQRCKRYRTTMVLLSLDIDHFKNINDSFGHPAGDDVLKSLVARCKDILRTTDVFGRIGGEEFLAAVTQTGIIAGEKTAERLRKRIEQERVETHGAIITYTVSIGITEIRDDDESIENLLKRADDALYKAKNSGRNQYKIL